MGKKYQKKILPKYMSENMAMEQEGYRHPCTPMLACQC